MKTIHLFLFLILLGGCQDHEHPETGKEGHEHGHEAEKKDKKAEAVKTVELTPMQAKNAGISTGKPREMALASSIKATGKLELPPQNEAGISAMIGGVVKKVNVIQGDRVKEGEVIALLEHPDIAKMQQRYLQKKNKMEYLEAEHDRLEKLYEDSIGAEKEYQKIHSEYMSILATVMGLKRQLETIGVNVERVDKGKIRSDVPVRSPIAGYISNIDAKVGAYIEPGHEMFEVLDNHHVHIDLMVYEKDIHKVRPGQSILFHFSNREQKETMKAEVFAVGNSFDEEKKTGRVHAEIKEEKGRNFLPGMYVEALINTDSVTSTVVPKEAVVMHEGTHYVFLQRESQKGHRHFERIPVTAGITDKGYREIEAIGEFPKDPEVVFTGAHYILRHMLRGAGGGHSH